MFKAELEKSGTCQIALRIAQRRFRSRVSSLAIFAAIRRASSRVNDAPFAELVQLSRTRIADEIREEASAASALRLMVEN
jgi:hypothetical protein